MYTAYCDAKIGERVARFRKQRNPNRRDFVRRIPGMSERDVREIENGERQPRLEEVILLALFLETTKGHLAHGRGRQKLGLQEKGYLLYMLGEQWPRIRQQLARYHNGH